MNLNKYLLIGTLSVIATNAFATGENIMTSKKYTDETFQTKIPTGTYGANNSVVTYNNATGEVNERYIWGSGLGLDGVWLDQAITGLSNNNLNILVDEEPVAGHELTLAEIKGSLVPAEYIGLAIAKKQKNISYTITQYTYDANLRPTADGSLVETTNQAGTVTQRGIATAPAYDANDQLTNGSWIPTVGAMMSAISSGITAAAPTGTANTIANYDANGDLGTGIATANAPAYTSGSLTNGTNIATIAAVDTREAKMTCAGWPESVAVADRTDANCWLWQRN
jgi:hypothetical protein